MDPTDEHDESTARVIGWLERELGGRVTRISRQPRWRPVWFATLDRGDAQLELCVRGDRTDMQLIFPLDHEMRLQSMLHDHGIPVAAVHGWIDDPAAYVMDTVGGANDFDRLDHRGARRSGRRLPPDPRPDPPPPGRGVRRCGDHARRVGGGVVDLRARPLRARLAGVEAAPRSVSRVLPRLVAAQSADLARTRSGDRLGLRAVPPRRWADARRARRRDRAHRRPDDGPRRLAPARHGDRIRRDGPAVRPLRSELSGEPVDLDAIQRHHFAFCLTNQLSVGPATRVPPPTSDLMTNRQWCYETNLFATEALAEILGDRTADGGDARAASSRRRRSSSTTSSAGSVRSPPTTSTSAISCGRCSGRLDTPPASTRSVTPTQRPISTICTPSSATDPTPGSTGEAELERFVLEHADTARHDETLCALFHRRHLRAQMSLGPRGSAMTRHARIQPFHPSTDTA